MNAIYPVHTASIFAIPTPDNVIKKATVSGGREGGRKVNNAYQIWLRNFFKKSFPRKTEKRM
jgi:hypothetical protein